VGAAARTAQNADHFRDFRMIQTFEKGTRPPGAGRAKDENTFGRVLSADLLTGMLPPRIAQLS
jgi:hypothetical protein|tara:strand:- start:19983 stop:20171 length:189 start_codon:yes stop_codon:yes gene_type:complete